MSFKNYLIIASLTFACAQNALAMRCNAIKAFKFARKTNQLKALSFCNKPTANDASDDLKRLQETHAGIKIINPNCFNVITKNAPCAHQDSCCKLVKKDAQQAWIGKEIRLDMDKRDPSEYVTTLITTKIKLKLLEENNIDAQKIASISPNMAAIKPMYEKYWIDTKDMLECLVYSANIYGCTWYECSGRYYEKNPKGIFYSTKDMTPEEHARQDLQDECNKIYKRVMKSNGDTINSNILLGWRKSSLDPAYVGEWLDRIEDAMKYFQREEDKKG